MEPKPGHLGPEYGRQFSDQSVVANYHFRPPYPAETFDILDSLLGDRPRRVLDVGTGTGEIARGMAPRVDYVDAVDIAETMIDMARSMPGGDSFRISWIVGDAETAPLNPPYGLITAGASLHWLAWDVVLPRFRSALARGGVLVCLDVVQFDQPWGDDLAPVFARFSTNREFRPYNVVEEIERRGLFATLGHETTAPVPFTQLLADYVASFHARNGFSLDRMTPDAAAAFDREVAALVKPYTAEDQVTFRIAGDITWGLPLAPT
jgi:SAM-dependent methyltransferase